MGKKCCYSLHHRSLRKTQNYFWQRFIPVHFQASKTLRQTLALPKKKKTYKTPWQKQCTVVNVSPELHRLVQGDTNNHSTNTWHNTGDPAQPVKTQQFAYIWRTGGWGAVVQHLQYNTSTDNSLSQHSEPLNLRDLSCTDSATPWQG